MIWSKVSLETIAGFPVDLADDVFQRLQRFGQVVVLRVQVALALGLLLVLLDRRQVDRPQTLDARRETLETLLPFAFAGIQGQVSTVCRS